MIKIIPYASGSDGNLYLLLNGENKYLIECGVDKRKIRSFLMGNGLMISDLKGCFISHAHT